MCTFASLKKKSDRVNSAGRTSYVERNSLMVEDSNFVVVYFVEEESREKDGTRLAYKYALKQKKNIITVKSEYQISLRVFCGILSGSSNDIF